MDELCITCGKEAEYTVWGMHPMKTYCYEHLVEWLPQGYCYVYDKNWRGTFMIDGVLQNEPR